MRDKKCAIILNDEIKNIDISDYDLLIGSENGSKFVMLHEDNIETYHIGDFDSVETDFKELISNKNNSRVLDMYSKLWSDGEEAILFAIENGYLGQNIDVFVEINGRMDHFAIILSVLHKYGANLIGNDVKINISVPNSETLITKGHKYVSAIFFERTYIKTTGLKWDVDKEFDQDSGTTFVSNEISGDSFSVNANKKVLFIQSKD